jgi:hypothetical protein
MGILLTAQTALRIAPTYLSKRHAFIDSSRPTAIIVGTYGHAAHQAPVKAGADFVSIPVPLSGSYNYRFAKT